MKESEMRGACMSIQRSTTYPKDMTLHGNAQPRDPGTRRRR